MEYDRIDSTNPLFWRTEKASRNISHGQATVHSLELLLRENASSHDNSFTILLKMWLKTPGFSVYSESPVKHGTYLQLCLFNAKISSANTLLLSCGNLRVMEAGDGHKALYPLRTLYLNFLLNIFFELQKIDNPWKLNTAIKWLMGNYALHKKIFWKKHFLTSIFSF